MTAYAHSLPDKPKEAWQPLDSHLAAVAKQAAEFAEVFGSADWAWNAGWLHDVGKVAKGFQCFNQQTGKKVVSLHASEKVRLCEVLREELGRCAWLFDRTVQGGMEG